MVLSIIGSLLLGLVWLKFFRKIDSFEPESWKATFICLFLGAISPLFIEPFVGLSPFLKSLSQKSTGADLLQFALFKVAAVEELVKLIPFLMALAFTPWVNESVDYIKYPALSALGFATVENIIYATNYGVDVLHIRGLLCVSGHIFYTALPGYFLWLGRTQPTFIKGIYLVFGYLLGLLCHGFYDYFLFEKSADGLLGILSVMLCVGFMYVFKRMLLKTIRESEFFHPPVLKEIIKAGVILFWGLISIFVFIGFALSINQGTISAGLDYWVSSGIQALIGTITITSLLALDQKDFKEYFKK